MWIYILSIAALLAVAAGGCPKHERMYYEEVGCRPKALDQNGCPTSYDCSGITKRSRDKCHFQGRQYGEGEQLALTPATACLAQCRCQQSTVNDKSLMMFSCLDIECPEWFGPGKPGCYLAFEHNSCCGVKEICGTEETQKKTSKDVCKDGNEVYQIGEMFYPQADPCLQCICQPGYNGSLVEPFCLNTGCKMEIKEAHFIANGCVPVYGGEMQCCPVNWRCPTNSDTVIASGARSHSKLPPGTDQTCKFGELSLRIGEKLSVNEEWQGTECMCRVPPQIVCIYKPGTY